MTGLAAGAISLAGVGKRYTKYEDTPSMVYGVLRAFGRTKTSDLWAVRDVELEIRPGESVGVIGTNGSGKSTLLQMLCGVTSPTEGSVRVGGRIAPLISVGVGFHPELTGRENVYVNGAILGLSPQDIDARFDDIVAFAGIGDFIETPVKFYSSGMYVRLGFSVAAHVDPDVLLLDEVLAVGDLAFQLRCFEHLRVLRERGTTVVMVSHNMPSVEGFCDRGVLMRKGQILHDGPVRDVVESYHKVMASDGNQEGLGLLGEGIEAGTAEVLGMTISDADGMEKFHFDAGETAIVEIEIRALRDIRAPFLYVAVTSDTGAVVYAEQNIFDPFPSLRAGQQSRMSFRLPLRLATGAYTVRTSVGRANDAEVEQMQNADDAALLSPPQTALLYVQGRHTVDGVADLGGEFRVADRFLGQS